MRLIPLLALFCVACGGPTDSDGDGLTDDREDELGTDPTNPDTDGDGWGDGREVEVGTDPLNADEKPYEGGWPFNSAKDGLGDATAGAYAEVGQQVPRLRTLDQFGEVVDLYDFAGGRPIIIESTAFRCAGCPEWADQLSRQDTIISSAIDEQRVWWIRYLSSNQSGNVATARDLDVWNEEHPLNSSPLLLDDNARFQQFIDQYRAKNGITGSFPAFIAVDPVDMTVTRPSDNSLGWLADFVDEL